MSASVREYSGVNATTPFAGTASSISTGTSGYINGPQSVSVTPTVSGTLPVSCFGANSAMGVTAHTSGATEDYTGYVSTQNGNGWISPYNGNEGQTGAIQTSVSAYSANATWNVTANNGPSGAQYLMMLNPQPTATPSPGPIAFVQGINVASSGQSASLSPTLSATPTANDLLLACVSTQDSNTIATPSGWTQAGEVSNGGSIILYAFYRYAPSSSPTAFTFSASAADWMTASVREYAGVSATTPVNAFASSVSTGTSNDINGIQTVTTTPSIIGTLPVSCFAANSAMGVTAHTSGGTENYSAYPSTQNGNGYVSPYNGDEGQTGPVQSGTSAYSATATWNVTANNGPHSAQVLAMLAPLGTGTPTPAPTPTGIATSLPTNGPTWPTSFLMFPSSPIWSSPVPSSPQLLSNSATIIASVYPSSGAVSACDCEEFRNQPAGLNDNSHPVYFATNSDPVINISCSQSTIEQCAPNAFGLPVSMNMPQYAKAAQAIYGEDDHFAVVQPCPVDTLNQAYACHEFDFYVAPTSHPTAIDPPGSNADGTGGSWSAGNTIGPSNELDMGDIYTASGSAIGSGASGYVYATTAVNAAIGAGMVTPAELIGGAGAIHHAIFVGDLCQSGSTVYPGNAWNSEGSCTGGTGPPLGARIWSDVPCSTVSAWTAENNPEKAVLCALNQYGGFVGDSGGGTGNITGTGIGFTSTVGGEASYAYSSGDQWTGLASYGWTSTNTTSGDLQPRWYDNNNQQVMGTYPNQYTVWEPPDFSFAAHMHVLAPCVTQQTC
jgi:hypothetical protein